jgi:hypothetical protein
MQRLFLHIITFIVATYLVGCGGTSAKEPSSDDTVSNKNSIEIDKALKNKNYIKLHSSLKGFELSNDGTKTYGHSEASFYVTDITKVYPIPINEELYEFKNIARLEIPLPDASSLEMTKPNQSISSITISPDEKFAYLITNDPRSHGGKGTLIIVDISNPKKPKVVNRDTINLYFDDIVRVLPNAKHLLVGTSDGGPLDLTIIDIQDATKPKVVGRIKTADYINAISISNDSKRAYIATDDSIEIINLEDPTLPIRITKIDRDYGSTLALVVTKNKKRMYASFEKSLQLYDIEKDNFKLITSYQIDGDGHYDDIENLILSDDENTLYATCYNNDKDPDNSLVVFDITDKDKLDFKKNVIAPSNAVLVYDVQDQALAPDEKKFYALTAYFHIINLENH